MLLYKDLPETLPSSDSRSPRTTQRTCAVEHSTIQKNSVQYIVGTVDASNVLPSSRHSCSINGHQRNNSDSWYCFGVSCYCCTFKLNSEPDPILLEDRGGETSGCRNTATDVLFVVELNILRNNRTLHRRKKRRQGKQNKTRYSSGSLREVRLLVRYNMRCVCSSLCRHPSLAIYLLISNSRSWNNCSI